MICRHLRWGPEPQMRPGNEASELSFRRALGLPGSYSAANVLIYHLLNFYLGTKVVVIEIPFEVEGVQCPMPSG